MTATEELSHKEISRRIVTGMGLVYDLFNEMNAFFRLVLDGLESSELEIVPLKSRFTLPKSKIGKYKTAADDYVKTDMGFIAELGVGGVEEEEAGEAEEDQEAELEKKGISITEDSQFLAVRAILYNSEKDNNNSFDPFVVGAVLSSFSRYPRGKTLKRAEGEVKIEKAFRLKKRVLLYRCMSQLEPTVKKNQDISWVIPKYDLSATVSGIVGKPLVEFDKEEKLNAFVEEMITLAENA